MRSLLPFAIGVAATLAGLGAARVRDAATPGALVAHRGAMAILWVGVVATGTALLVIGWWASGLKIAGADPSLLSSAAYAGAAVELFLGGLVATRVIARPPVRISVGALGRRPPR